MTDARRWTKRQREVLDLLAKGRTNAEIATALGITFDGAKWHVSEIMGRLGVDSREDAAEYWRQQQGLPSRFAQFRRAILGGVAGKVALAGVALAMAAVAVVIVVSWPGDETSPSEPTTPGVTALTRGENYAYTPALAYIAPDGTVPVVNGDGTVRTPRLLDGCATVPMELAGGVVQLSGLGWSMNGDRAFCVGPGSRGIRSAWPPGNPSITNVFAADECGAGIPVHLFWPGISPDGLGFSCTVTGGDYVVRDAAGTHTLVQTTRFGQSWSPAGHQVVSVFESGSDAASNVHWKIFDRDGVFRLIIAVPPDHTARLSWTIDGKRAAFTNQDGIQIVDTTTWTVRKIGDGAAWRLAWVLDDTAILLVGTNVLISADDGRRLPLPSLPEGISYPAPNGYLLAQAVPSEGGDTLVIGITDLRTGALTRLPATAFERGNVDLVWSGDSERLCWTHPNATRDGLVIDCTAATGGPVVRVAAPWITHTSKIPNFDQSGRFQGLSPDLAKVAYTLPGLDNPDAPQELWISDLDGRNAVHVGPTASALGYEWQPDAVYRPQLPLN